MKETIKEIIKENYSNCNVIDKIKGSGVYLIKDGLNIIYVGFSSRLKDRLYQSIYERVLCNGVENNIELTIIKGVNNLDLSILEILLINEFNPIFNKSKKYETQSYFIKSDDIISKCNVEKIKLYKV